MGCSIYIKNGSFKKYQNSIGKQFDILILKFFFWTCISFNLKLLFVEEKSLN